MIKFNLVLGDFFDYEFFISQANDPDGKNWDATFMLNLNGVNYAFVITPPVTRRGRKLMKWYWEKEVGRNLTWISYRLGFWIFEAYLSVPTKRIPSEEGEKGEGNESKTVC